MGYSTATNVSACASRRSPADCCDSGAFVYHEPDARVSRICAIGESAVAAGLEGCAFARVATPLATPAPRGYAWGLAAGYAVASRPALRSALRFCGTSRIRHENARAARHESVQAFRRFTKRPGRFLDRSETIRAKYKSRHSYRAAPCRLRAHGLLWRSALSNRPAICNHCVTARFASCGLGLYCCCAKYASRIATRILAQIEREALSAVELTAIGKAVRKRRIARSDHAKVSRTSGERASPNCRPATWRP